MEVVTEPVFQVGIGTMDVWRAIHVKEKSRNRV